MSVRAKVLHLLDSAGLYGAEKVVLALLEELRESSFPGILGCIREREEEKPVLGRAAEEKGIPVHYFTMRRGPNWLGLRRMMEYIRERRIPLLHLHGYKPDIYFGFLPRKPFCTVATVHGWTKEMAGMKFRAYEYLDARALGRLDRVVAVSRAVHRDLLRRGVRRKVDLIPNGIPLPAGPAPDRLAARRRFGLDPEDWVLGCLGRLTEVKGYPYLIAAMPAVLREIPNCRLVIAGSGPLEGALRRQTEELGLAARVKFPGYVSQMDSFLAMIDFFLLPSLTEGLPLALLEALAAGKPVIATAVGGIPEVITGPDNGVLVPPANTAELAKAVVRLYRRPEEHSLMAVRGRRIVEEGFSSRHMAVRYARLYGELLEGKGCASPA